MWATARVPRGPAPRRSPSIRGPLPAPLPPAGITSTPAVCPKPLPRLRVRDPRLSPQCCPWRPGPARAIGGEPLPLASSLAGPTGLEPVWGKIRRNQLSEPPTSPRLHIPLPLGARVSCKVLSRSTSPAPLSLPAVPPKLTVVPAAGPAGVQEHQGRGCCGVVSCAHPRAGCQGSPGSGGVTHRALLCAPHRPGGAPAASATSGGAAERLQRPPEALPGGAGGPGQGG